MANLLPLADLLSARDARWPTHHERSLDLARARVRPGEMWALFSYWRPELPTDVNWTQYATLEEGLNTRPDLLPRVHLQTLVAHFDAGPNTRTRFEPWVFLAGSMKIGLCGWMLRLFRQDLAIWCDGTALHAVTPREIRSLGDYRAAMIASVIRESSPERARFLGFDLPTSTPIAAIARSAYVGAVYP